ISPKAIRDDGAGRPGTGLRSASVGAGLAGAGTKQWNALAALVDCNRFVWRRRAFLLSWI
ncbi:hypothetical protein L2230_13585, partial [Xanthomonas perforans]|nr:hypothetical protein [Xanthomonas perforans]